MILILMQTIRKFSMVYTFHLDIKRLVIPLPLNNDLTDYHTNKILKCKVCWRHTTGESQNGSEPLSDHFVATIVPTRHVKEWYVTDKPGQLLIIYNSRIKYEYMNTYGFLTLFCSLNTECTLSNSETIKL